VIARQPSCNDLCSQAFLGLKIAVFVAACCTCAFLRVKKLLNLRVFDDGEGKRWSKSVSDLKLEILCVSQVRQRRLLTVSQQFMNHAFTVSIEILKRAANHTSGCSVEMRLEEISYVQSVVFLKHCVATLL